MDINLKNRKVVITGVSEGIGRSLALAFGEAGAHVAGSARNRERLSAIESKISGTGHFFSSADFSKSDDIQTFHNKAISAMGGVDILINNVGSIQKLAGFFDLSDEDWQEVFDVNLMSAVRACRLFSSSLKQSVSPRIINITSTVKFEAVIQPDKSEARKRTKPVTSPGTPIRLSNNVSAEEVCISSTIPCKSFPDFSAIFLASSSQDFDQTGPGETELTNTLSLARVRAREIVKLHSPAFTAL